MGGAIGASDIRGLHAPGPEHVVESFRHNILRPIPLLRGRPRDARVSIATRAVRAPLIESDRRGRPAMSLKATNVLIDIRHRRPQGQARSGVRCPTASAKRAYAAMEKDFYDEDMVIG